MSITLFQMSYLLIWAALVSKISSSVIQRRSPTADLVDASSWLRTVIAVELSSDSSDRVFLHGGFTNGSLSRCVGDVSIDPCAIPIRHRLPLDDPNVGAYTDWAKGDHFLDFHGPEDGQGKSNGVRATGTPTWKLNSRAGLDVLGSLDVSTNSVNSTFWVVDLDMECSDSNGYFEIQINLKPSVSKLLSSRGAGKPGMLLASHRALPVVRNLDSTRSKSRTPKRKQKGLNVHRQKRHTEDRVSKTEQLFSLEGLTRGNKNFTPRKPMQMASLKNRGKSDFVQGVRHRTTQLRGPRNPSCIDDFPYTTSRFVGKCGYANILRQDSGDCTINKL